jgi:hypothetical protein
MDSKAAAPWAASTKSELDTPPYTSLELEALKRQRECVATDGRTGVSTPNHSHIPNARTVENQGKSSAVAFVETTGATYLMLESAKEEDVGSELDEGPLWVK